MKRVRDLLLLSATVAAVAHAQAAAHLQEPPAVVLKQSWSKERVNWERDPFGGPLENFDEMRARARNEKRIDDAKRGGGTADQVKREARADAANLEALRRNSPPARYGFLYKITVKNVGPKTIRAVDWDYVFIDAATREELGRRQFASEERIEPGKKKELAFFVPMPPTQKISAQALDRRERDGLTERVELVRVLYEDGTVWPHPPEGEVKRP